MKKIFVLTTILLASNAFGGPKSRTVDAFSIAIQVVEKLYCKPLGLEDVEYRVSTGRFDPGKTPTDFRITVDRKMDDCGVTLEDLARQPAEPLDSDLPQPLLQIDVLVIDGKLLGFDAEGQAMNCSQPVKEEVLQARRKASLAIAGEMMGWMTIDEVPAKGGGTVLFFRYDGEKTYSPLNNIHFSACNGLLDRVGSIPSPD
jgi:hypothetical protein